MQNREFPRPISIENAFSFRQKLKHFWNIKYIKWSAASLWLFRPNSGWNFIETTSIEKTHPTLEKRKIGFRPKFPFLNGLFEPTIDNSPADFTFAINMMIQKCLNFRLKEKALLTLIGQELFRGFCMILKWGACCRASWGSIEKPTIGKTHPTLRKIKHFAV